MLFTFLAFALMILFITKPFEVRLPFTKRKLPMDYMAGSIIGVLIILLAGTLSPEEALSSLLGRPGFSPVTIIILFMSIAYVAISLDSTGFFEYVSLKIVMRAKGHGKSLFFSIYFLSGLITLFTSNDIVILTLTPIIFYFGKHAKINVIPYLIAEFFAANIWSMAFYFGNPTNIIAAAAHGMTFLQFSQWMVLPTIAGGLTCLGLLYVIFKKDINVHFKKPTGINPDDFLKDKACAFATFAAFCLMIFGLAVSTSLGVEMWLVALVAAGGLFAYDSVAAFYEYTSGATKFYHGTFRYHLGTTGRYRFRLKMINERMPWKLVPFLLCSFVMVGGLAVTGVVDTMASFITMVSVNVFAAAISMGFLSSLVCNIMNNQPMTVMFTRITESPSFGLTGSLGTVSVFALIIGSNLGANLTLMGALAGIMWAKILMDKKNPVTYMGFAKVGFRVMPAVILITCAVLAMEFAVFGG